ncbi:hypothetical protein GGR71_003428 [Xanthomonas sp. F1]
MGMWRESRQSTRVLCLLVGVLLGFAAFCVGVDPGSLLRSGVGVLLAIGASIYLLSVFLGSDAWRSRLIGLWPGI